MTFVAHQNQDKASRKHKPEQQTGTEEVMPWKLKRTNQCAKCPWKVSTNPHDIPNGYSETRHRDLSRTIADDTGNVTAILGKKPLRLMACHEHPEGDEAHCIGWLMNQLGPGNNIALRFQILTCGNAGKIRLDGPQHKRFEDTFPKNTNRNTA